MAFLARGLQFLGYTYLLRVPLVTWALLVALWAGSFQSSVAEPILRGIFDIASPQSSVWATAVQFGTLTLAALLAGTSMGVSGRLVVCNAHARFRAVPVELSRGIELMFRLIPFLSFAAVVGTALVRSESPWAGKLPGLVLGAGGWYALTVGASNFVNAFHSQLVARFQAGGWVPTSEPGYLDAERGTIQGRHLFATYQLLLALTAYVVYCIASAFDLEFLGGHFLVPTLSLVLVVLTLGCWGLAGVAFFIDRYRVPLLLPLAALAFTSGRLPQSDYFYQGLPRPQNMVNSGPLTPDTIIEAHEKGPDANTPIVLVATTGGGIQSSAWTARVLTGLNQQITLSHGSSFAHHIRLVSAVSGGSVGAMYFVAAYEKGEVAQEAAAGIVAHAEESSLDQVTWGLAYPDLIFGLVPALKGLGVNGGELRTSDSGFIFMDRGRMLEASWRKRLPPAQADATLGNWQKDAADGVRPAVIFNSTLVETGDRYLLSSTEFLEPKANAAKIEQYDGRWEFSKLYPESDLRVRTAARLSATFPYVTPAARMLRNDAEASEDGRLYRPEPHAVDGGYYDNYGMASLLDWLNNGLQAKPALHPRVMIIEIRAAPTGSRGRPSSSSYGSLFQITHPLQTMANVRGTGQLSHNALDETLMNRIYGSQLCEATFEFNNVDALGCPRNEPLNWHLTRDDKDALDKAWKNTDAIQQSLARVRSFLAGGACLP